MSKKKGCPVRYRSKFDIYRRGNQIPKKTNWTSFAKRFDIGVLDLDMFATDMGYCEFDDLDISIGPRSLYSRSPTRFAKALRQNSIKAKHYPTKSIGRLV